MDSFEFHRIVAEFIDSTLFILWTVKSLIIIELTHLVLVIVTHVQERCVTPVNGQWHSHYGGSKSSTLTGHHELEEVVDLEVGVVLMARAVGVTVDGSTFY